MDLVAGPVIHAAVSANGGFLAWTSGRGLHLADLAACRTVWTVTVREPWRPGADGGLWVESKRGGRGPVLVRLDRTRRPIARWDLSALPPVSVVAAGFGDTAAFAFVDGEIRVLALASLPQLPVDLVGRQNAQ